VNIRLGLLFLEAPTSAI